MSIIDRAQRIFGGATAVDKDRVPPGQTVTQKFPVLSYGQIPQIDLATWTFEVIGLVDNPIRFTWEQFLARANDAVTADFHCVTGWSRLDNRWEGLFVRDLFDEARIRPTAAHVMVHCYGGYTTNLPLAALLNPDVLIAYRHDGIPLESEHGGPARLIVPDRYAYKSAKWIKALELMPENKRGFWELHGYNSNADPWRSERYDF